MMSQAVKTLRRVAVGTTAVAALGVVLWLSLRGRPPSEAFIRLTNVGVAQIENRSGADAVETLTRALELRPASPLALRNLARAHLISKDAAHAGTAVGLLEKALEQEPASAATHYLLGLALSRAERYADAVSHLEQAARLDPMNATVRYQLGRAYERNNQHDEAYEQFNETIRLDPLHDSAYYRLAAHARQKRDRDAVIRLTREFERLKKLFGLRPEDVHERCVHTDPEPVDVGAVSLAPETAIAVTWTDVTGKVFADDADRAATAAAIIEVDAAGVATVFAVSADGAMALLRVSPGGTFERTVVRPPDAGLPIFRRCVVGDFHLDITSDNKNKTKLEARNDVFLIGDDGARLLERTGDASFEDRTVSVGLSGVRGHAAAWIDYDHNGVLDLLVASDAGLQLWQNNTYVISFDAANAEREGDAGFVDVTDTVGLTTPGPVYDVAGIELDDNVAVDVAAAGGDGPSPVFVNQRAGYFKPLASPPGPWPAALRLAVDDVNNDGRIDALLVNPHEALALYTAVAQRHRFDFADMTAAGAVLVDYDNDGRLDVCVFGARSDAPASGRLRFWRNGGDDVWTDTTAATGADALALPAVVDVVPFDCDNDGDTDLLLVTADHRLRLLRNDGGNANGQLKLRLVSILTNPTGLGQRIALRDAGVRVERWIGRLPVEIGVGRSEKLDALHVQWTNGVVDNALGVVPSAEPYAFVEKMVEIGSCPFLFAWNGTRFRFVTDTLGNAPIGLSLRRDEPLPADPDEFVRIGDASVLGEGDDRYTLLVSEAYREVLYLDHVRLTAVDHTRDVEIHPTDKLMPPPFPKSDLWALANVRPPRRVSSDDGIDRTAGLRSIDGVYAPPGRPLPPPFRGMCQPLTLTLDFGPLDVERPLVLALTGWLRYGSASVNIALDQNPGLTIIPPTLEVETEGDTWTPVDVVVGMPAGKTKTILCDLTGKLPPGARRLRLRTTFELRWDRIALGERVPLDADARHDLPPVAADLQWLGFPDMRSRGPGHPITPDAAAISQTPKWRTTPQGWCTRYGDVLELLDEADGKLAVLNAGDAITLGFDARELPPLDSGFERTFFYYSVGWEKDSDYNVIDGDTVEPLPAPDGVHTSDDDWRLRYNTRFVPRDRFGLDRRR